MKVGNCNAASVTVTALPDLSVTEQSNPIKPPPCVIAPRQHSRHSHVLIAAPGSPPLSLSPSIINHHHHQRRRRRRPQSIPPSPKTPSLNFQCPICSKLDEKPIMGLAHLRNDSLCGSPCITVVCVGVCEREMVTD